MKESDVPLVIGEVYSYYHKDQTCGWILVRLVDDTIDQEGKVAVDFIYPYILNGAFMANKRAFRKCLTKRREKIDMNKYSNLKKKVLQPPSKSKYQEYSIQEENQQLLPEKGKILYHSAQNYKELFNEEMYLNFIEYAHSHLFEDAIDCFQNKKVKKSQYLYVTKPKQDLDRSYERIIWSISKTSFGLVIETYCIIFLVYKNIEGCKAISSNYESICNALEKAIKKSEKDYAKIYIDFFTTEKMFEKKNVYIVKNLKMAPFWD